MGKLTLVEVLKSQQVRMIILIIPLCFSIFLVVYILIRIKITIFLLKLD